MLDVINDSKANFLIVEDNVPKKMADSMVDDTGITLITGMTVENMKSADQSYIDWIENNVSILVEGLSANRNWKFVTNLHLIKKTLVFFFYLHRF